jgi:glutamyl/glutaminyl-tRNA synthetase
MSSIRTRFAPSPTGLLHVGGIRTALFAWLVARQAGGQFILRLEDTDQSREVSGADQHIIDCLKALGLLYDEGPDINGSHGPYRQSQRLDIYKKWGQKLVEEGRAYADPYSPQEVQAFREQAQKEKRPFLYRHHRPDNPPLWDGSQPLRFKSDPKAYDWHDEVMGDLSTGPDVIDDFILIKSDGFPTYNFAHIVDDAEMKITHVIRGQEFLASMPNYLNLYEALGIIEQPKTLHADGVQGAAEKRSKSYKIYGEGAAEAATPQSAANTSSATSSARRQAGEVQYFRPVMATMPHIMGPGGKKKLSKRDGAKDLLDYIRDGYLPEALVSFIATLGWNDGTEQEVFTTQELKDKFSLDRVQKSGAVFDERRLLWVNGHFIRNLPIDELVSKAETYWPEESNDASESYKKRVLALVQERLKFFAELPELTRFFFVDLPVDESLISGHKQLKKLSHGELHSMLSAVRSNLEESDFSEGDLQNRLNALLTIAHTKPMILFSLVRIATTQSPASPGLAETLAVLGKETTLRRIDEQILSL